VGLSNWESQRLGAWEQPAELLGGAVGLGNWESQRLGAWEQPAELLGGAVPAREAAGSGRRLAGGALVGAIGSSRSLSCVSDGSAVPHAVIFTLQFHNLEK